MANTDKVLEFDAVGRKKPNWELKSKVIKSGCFNEYNNLRKQDYLHFKAMQEFKITADDYNKLLGITFANIDYLRETYSNEFVEESKKLRNAKVKRIVLLKHRIEKLLEKPCIFATFTFTDKTLLNTSQDTRRRYVRRFLTNYGNYVANVDYGAKNGREHYHAIIQTDKVKIKDWNFGDLDVKKIKVENAGKLAHYVAKLKNHAIKETAKNSYLIYNRTNSNNN